MKQEISIVKPRPINRDRPLLTFLYEMLRKPEYECYIKWKDISNGVFRIIDPPGLAQLWGDYKGIHNMTYDKMSRSMRHYYKMNVIKKANFKGLRHCYQFNNGGVSLPPQQIAFKKEEKQPDKTQ